MQDTNAPVLFRNYSPPTLRAQLAHAGGRCVYMSIIHSISMQNLFAKMAYHERMQEFTKTSLEQMFPRREVRHPPCTIGYT